MSSSDPLNRVVFIQKVAAFVASRKLENFIKLAYVNQSWADTIENYSFHSFGKRTSDEKEDWNTEEVLECALECDALLWLVKALLSSKPVLDRIKCVLLACQSYTSINTMRSLFETILEVGGAESIKQQLTAIRNGGATSLMMMCCNYESSVEKIELICDKLVEVGGTGLLKSQLANTDAQHRNCLMFVCLGASSPSHTEMIKLIIRKSMEVGGPELVKTQITATDDTHQHALIFLCQRASSFEGMQMLFEKIVDLGGMEFLKAQLSAVAHNGSSSFMHLCSNSTSSADLIKYFLEKIVEAGGVDLLSAQLSLTNKGGYTVLKLACSYCSSKTEIIQVILQKIVEAGGVELLKSQLTNTSCKSGSVLMLLTNPLRSPSAEVLRLVASLLHHFDHWKKQYNDLQLESKMILKEKGNISDSGASWVPDSETIAEVKKLLSRGKKEAGK